MTKLTVWPPVIRNCKAMLPVPPRVCVASSVNPSPLKVSRSRAGSMLAAIWTTTWSLIKLVSVGGGMSTILRSKPGGRNGFEDPGGCCCPPSGGVVVLGWMLTTWAPSATGTRLLLSVRLVMICVCAVGGSCVLSRTLLNGPKMPVLSATQSGSSQPATIDGKPGKPVVGLFNPTCGPTTLPGPPLAAPVASESGDIVPTGKVDCGSWPGAKLMKVALAPTKPPTMLLAPAVTVPLEEDGSMVPRFIAANPPAMTCVAEGLTTDPVADESWIKPRLMPAKPPRKLSEVPVTAPDALEEKIPPAVTPTNPPTTLFGPELPTAPDAVALMIVPGPFLLPSAPMNPPSTLS